MNYNKNSLIIIALKEFSFNINDLSNNEKYILEYLFRHFIFTGSALTRFKQVSKKHLELGIAQTIGIIKGKKRGKFCYNKALNTLINKGIIERTDYYSKKRGIAKSIRFTKDFIFCENNIDIIEKAANRKRIRTSNKLRSKTDTAIRKINLKKGVDIDKLVESHITIGYVKGLIETDTTQLENSTYWTVKDGLKYNAPIQLKKAICIAQEERKDVIYHKKERILIIEEKNEYIREKLRRLKLIYRSLLVMIESKDYFSTTISKTNNRLTSFFTIFPKSLLPYIELQKKEFVTFDISNSQFCFLANIIMAYETKRKTGREVPLYSKIVKETEYLEALSSSFNNLLDKDGELSVSTKSFLNAAYNGSLYEKVGSIANLTKPAAKQGMFIVAFSSHRYNPSLKIQIKKAFPEIIEFINEFKKIKPNENKSGFAVWLQRIESSICVCEILQKLQTKYLVLTRHDSFTTNTEKKEEFRGEVELYLSKYLTFGYNLKEETD